MWKFAVNESYYRIIGKFFHFDPKENKFKIIQIFISVRKPSFSSFKKPYGLKIEQVLFVFYHFLRLRLAANSGTRWTVGVFVIGRWWAPSLYFPLHSFQHASVRSTRLQFCAHRRSDKVPCKIHAYGDANGPNDRPRHDAFADRTRYVVHGAAWSGERPVCASTPLNFNLKIEKNWKNDSNRFRT